MARPNQESIETFMSITGVSEATAIQKLEEHGGDLTGAVNAHFNEGDNNRVREAHVAAPPHDDFMEIDDPISVESRRPPFSLLSSSGNLNPFSLLDPSLTRSVFDSGTNLTSGAPFVSYPRQVREIPIEVKDGNEEAGHSRNAPIIEDVTDTIHSTGPETHGTVIIDDDDHEVVPSPPSTYAARHDRTNDNIFDGDSTTVFSGPSAPGDDILPDYANDIEEEMIRAAIEASKRDAEMLNQQYDSDNDLRDPRPQPRQTSLEDVQLAHAVSLSLKDKTLNELESKAILESEGCKQDDVDDHGKSTLSNRRADVGSSSVQDDAEDLEEQPLVRHRSKPMSSGSVETARDVEEHIVSPLSSPRQQDNRIHSPQNGADFPDEWGGISSLEHDEAVMLEAALFGGIPEGSGYRLPYAPHQHMQNGDNGSMGPYQWRMPRPPSPSLVSQRLLREQQDDEYLASLQADKEKELKAKQEAESALEEARQREEESRRKAEEEQEIERQLTAKEASLPLEPTTDDMNAVNLVVRMPDGSRRGRRFLKSDKLQCLFDYIDVGRAVKPGTYKLVRPYPRRAFSDGESTLTLDNLGLTSKQEALFLELI